MKKSKVDAIIRRKLEEAERRRLNDVDAAQRAVARERELYRLQVAPSGDSGELVLGPVPEHREVVVHIHPNYAPRRCADSYRFDPYSMEGVSRAIFTPIMKCQQFGNGQRVVWYEYQFRGLS